MKVVLTTLNAKYIHSALALYSLAKAGQGSKRTIVIKEYSINNQLLEILSDLYGEKPMVLGMACYIWNVEMVLALAGMVKKVLPETVIVLGGPEVSFDSASVFHKQPGVDYIIVGEGETTWVQLLNALATGKEVCEIPGLTFRRGDRVQTAKEPGVIPELDALPFAYDDQDMSSLQDKIIYYESSRGCPFSCQYCLSGALGGVRCRSLDKVYQELAFLIRHQVKQVKFVDRTFNAMKRHYFPILKFLAEQDCHTNFHFEIAADLLDEEVLVFLAQVPRGRFQFEIGVQSTAPATLRAIQRHNDWEKILQYVGTIKGYGNIHLHLDLIVGLPYETWGDFERSFNDGYRLLPHMLQIGFLKMLKGSGIRKDAKDHGYIYLDEAPYEVLANDVLSYGDIRRLKQVEEVFNQVYNSGNFSRSLAFLVQLYDQNPFQLFLSLAAYWEKRYFFLAAHHSKKIFLYLLDFVREQRVEAVAIFQELLKFDALMDHRRSGRPEFLPWNEFSNGGNAGGGSSWAADSWMEEKNAFWRNTHIVRKYIPDFTFSSWRELRKRYDIEVFCFDIPQWLQLGTTPLPASVTPVLFIHRGGTVTWQVISVEDFAIEKRG